MKCAATVCLVERLTSGPWIYWHDLEGACAHAASIGLDGIELFTDSPTQVSEAALRGLLSKHELGLAAVGTGAGKLIHGLTLTDEDKDVRARAIAFICDMTAFGAAFGAPAIIGSMQGTVGKGRTRGEAIELLRDGLAACGAHAAEFGVPLIYEPLNRYESDLVNTQQSAAVVLDGIDGVKTLADLFHMNIEEASVADAITEHIAQVGHVHLADSNRRPAGDGHTDLAGAGAALKNGGFDAWVSAEAFPWPDSHSAARTTVTAFKRWFA
ncbi:MAG: sugar phosphate isomerase [Planctomycetes bacterium]|nr:sugar phosphate isomerase [Planctomycetota bacterium]